MNVSPMMQQYAEAKAACGDAILLFRMGDFYELFHDDAKVCAGVLGLTLTSRDKGENPIPMAGFPFHQLEGYLAKLIRQGYRVAVCDQVEDPKQAKGIVRREVTRIVTAGTLTDEALLDPLATNLLVAVFSATPGKIAGAESAAQVGLAWTELSTGRFEAGVFPRVRVLDELARLEPSEVLMREDDGLMSPNQDYDWSVTLRPTWQFNVDEAATTAVPAFWHAWTGWHGLGCRAGWIGHWRGRGGIGLLTRNPEDLAGALILLLPHRQGQALEIDAATRRSLELTHTMRDRDRQGSLLSVIDQTCTSMGARLLATWLSAPLRDVRAIRQRHGSVQELLE